MGTDDTRIDGLLEGYLPRTHLQRVSLAQHQLAASPIGDRQRLALAAVGRQAGVLLADIIPPQPRQP